MIFGIDLGVREFYAVGLHEGGGEPLFINCHIPRGKSRYLELRAMAMHLNELVTEDDVVMVEEPPMAGPMNKRTFGQLSMSAGAILSATSAQSYLVPVSTWKKATVGNGAAKKDDVAEWLRARFPDLHAGASGDQNYVDAACIALYGTTLEATASRLGAGSLADPS